MCGATYLPNAHIQGSSSKASKGQEDNISKKGHLCATFVYHSFCLLVN